MLLPSVASWRSARLLSLSTERLSQPFVVSFFRDFVIDFAVSSILID
jgi:hypothetical protein